MSLQSTIYNILIQQGTDFSNTIILTDTLGNPISLSGYSNGQSQIRPSYYSTNATPMTVNVSANSVTITMSSNVSANVFPGTYVYDILLKDSSNNIVRIVEGQALVTPGVTNQTQVVV